MVRALSAFLDFCYLVRRDVITESTLQQIDDALSRFHRDRIIFYDCGVRPTGFSLPRQHSLVHYHRSIQLFGAPNGLCSSITESKHIKAVKQPWRRSSRYQPLGQMLVINQRLDKLAATRADFIARGIMDETDGPPVVELPEDGQHAVDIDQDQGPVDSHQVRNHVSLAKFPGVYPSIYRNCIT
jgi:hypothetical protein